MTLSGFSNLCRSPLLSAQSCSRLSHSCRSPLLSAQSPQPFLSISVTVGTELQSPQPFLSISVAVGTELQSPEPFLSISVAVASAIPVDLRCCRHRVAAASGIPARRRATPKAVWHDVVNSPLSQSLEFTNNLFSARPIIFTVENSPKSHGAVMAAGWVGKDLSLFSLQILNCGPYFVGSSVVTE